MADEIKQIDELRKAIDTTQQSIYALDKLDTALLQRKIVNESRRVELNAESDKRWGNIVVIVCGYIAAVISIGIVYAHLK